MSGDDPPRRASLPPGHDEADPYSDQDLEQLPSWWRENVVEFRRHGLRPYRPARFSDGEPVTDVLESLERTHDVTIRIRSIDPQDGGDWRIEVGGAVVAITSRFRHADGYAVYEVSSATVEDAVVDSLRNSE